MLTTSSLTNPPPWQDSGVVLQLSQAGDASHSFTGTLPVFIKFTLNQ
jgi:hypothetical protein